MTVRELLARLDSQELSEWLAFNDLEPLPDSYWQTGLVCATLANLWTAKGKSYDPHDFMPTGKPEPTIQEQIAILDALAESSASLPK
jgi:hypothetical protein